MHFLEARASHDHCWARTCSAAQRGCRCQCCETRANNSATGTRTRVARGRAEYPNQLDYSGSWPNLCCLCSHLRFVVVPRFRLSPTTILSEFLCAQCGLLLQYASAADHAIRGRIRGSIEDKIRDSIVGSISACHARSRSFGTCIPCAPLRNRHRAI